MMYTIISNGKSVCNNAKSLGEAKFIGCWIKTVHPDYRVLIRNENGREWDLIHRED